MGRIRRFGRVNLNDPASVAEGLPDYLRSLEGYLDSDGSASGYRRYLLHLQEWLEARIGFLPDDVYVGAITAVAETTMADWLAGVFKMEWRKR